MSDIEERLRWAHPLSPQCAAGSMLLLEAADELARLQSEVERLTQQLQQPEQDCQERIKADRLYCMKHGDKAAQEMVERLEKAEARVAELECMVKVFRGCIETRGLPAEGSRCHKLVHELVGESDE